MRCDRCIENNEAHTVTPGMMTRTVMMPGPGYWNEQNQWVESKDPNTTSVDYTCSKGHRWSITSGGYLDEPRTTILKDATPPSTEINLPSVWGVSDPNVTKLDGIEPNASGLMSHADMARLNDLPLGTSGQVRGVLEDGTVGWIDPPEVVHSCPHCCPTGWE